MAPGALQGRLEGRGASESARKHTERRLLSSLPEVIGPPPFARLAWLRARGGPAKTAPMPLITDSASLAALCGRLATADFVTVDTEFMRETTYWAKLCLVQVAGPEEAYCIDPLAAGIDLAPLYALLADPKVLKVFHAGRQDLEIFCHATKTVPTPVFDTQVAA